MAEQRWFEEQELRDLSRPTMDRAIEALDAGDVAEGRRLCEEMKHEWRYLHDLMAAGILSLVTFVQERLGDDGVEEAWRYGNERGWRRDVEKIEALDRKEIVYALAATWRAHSCSGTGANPGAFEIEEDDEKFTFRMNPCGSGQRLWRNGAYRGPDAMGVTKEAHDWSYGRKGFPLYCTHCSFMNEVQPIEWIGQPMYPSDPPDDYDRDPCVWYWYKDAGAIPERHWTRYGLAKPNASAGRGEA
jgi:hypothetical protein